MSLTYTADATVDLFRPGPAPLQARVALEAADDGWRVVLRQRTGDGEWQALDKNASPLPLDAARDLFRRTLAAKLDDGFLGAASEIPAAGAAAPGPDAARVRALLLQIEPAQWRLLSPRRRSRLVWRLGELRVAPAPRLVELLGSGDAMLDYCLAWALGRSGDAGAKPAMDELARRGSTGAVRRIARHAWLELATADERAAYAERLIADWPAALREVWASSAGDDADAALDRLLADEEIRRRFGFDDWLEQLDSVALAQPRARSRLLRELASTPLSAGRFRAVRHIAKAAEFRGDAELWALLQRRFEHSPPNFHRQGYRSYVSVGDDYVDADGELPRPDSRLAFSDRTRQYLTRRGWRTLRRLGSAGSVEFAPLAFAALVGYDDAAVGPPRVVERHVWKDGGWHPERSYRHRHHRAALFNQLLFKPGGPVSGSRHGLSWWSDAPLDAARPERWEPFVDRWDERPDLLLRLALEARSEWVQSFAVRALAEAPAYCARLGDLLWRRLLNSPFAPTAEFAYLQLNARIAAEPDRERRESWIALLLGSRHAPIAEAGLALLEEDPAAHAGSPALIAAVLTARLDRVRRQSRLLCQASLATPGVAEAALERVLGWLESADPFTEALDAVAANLGWILTHPYRTAAAGAEHARVLALLRHAAVAVRCLAVDWLIVHRVPVVELPPEIWRPLLESGDERLLAAGVRLLGALPPEVLRTQARLVLDFCLCPAAAVRRELFPRVADLAADAGFVDAALPRLLDVLFRAETAEGLRDDVHELLTGPLLDATRALPTETVLRLLQARSRAAQRLGEWLLQGRADEALDHADWARLARHETLEIRRRALDILERGLDVLGVDGLLPLLDSRWADGRGRVLGWLRERVPAAGWTLERVIALCDHAHEDVRDFGCERLGRRLEAGQDADGLFALAQHPSLKVQRFVADFLAALPEGPEPIARLRPYFLTVLAAVNRGRAAKTAVLGFLRRRALASEAAAREVAALFEHLAVTVAVGDRAQYVSGLYEIRRAYPSLASGLAVRAPETRPGRDADAPAPRERGDV